MEFFKINACKVHCIFYSLVIGIGYTFVIFYAGITSGICGQIHQILKHDCKIIFQYWMYRGSSTSTVFGTQKKPYYVISTVFQFQETLLITNLELILFGGQGPKIYKAKTGFPLRLLLSV